MTVDTRLRLVDREGEDHVTTEKTMLSRLSRPAVGRSLAPAAAIALIGVAVVHLLDGPGSLTDVPYIGALELALAAACAPLALLLLMRPTRSLWVSALTLNVAAMSAFLLSRTVGLPGSFDDIGNWTQTLGVLNLLSEAALISLALVALGAVSWPRRQALHT
jgi:hypothetical protein